MRTRRFARTSTSSSPLRGRHLLGAGGHGGVDPTAYVAGHSHARGFGPSSRLARRPPLRIIGRVSLYRYTRGALPGLLSNREQAMAPRTLPPKHPRRRTPPPLLRPARLFVLPGSHFVISAHSCVRYGPVGAPKIASDGCRDASQLGIVCSFAWTPHGVPTPGTTGTSSYRNLRPISPNRS